MSATTARVARALGEFIHAERKNGTPERFQVDSGSGARYAVDLDGDTPHCDCEDWQGPGDYCKHVWYVLLTDPDALDTPLTTNTDETSDDDRDDCDERDEPVRCEPADFGGGESTGVVDL
jgi:hypothetical protein